jgi:anti-sigma28 factor (negative regulator of flagellin synthesis)
VRIDGTNGLDNRGLPPSAGPVPQPVRTSGQQKAETSSDGVELTLSGEAFVRQASDAPQVDSQAVAQAKQLIQSGQLDTPESRLRAAKAILDFGA